MSHNVPRQLPSSPLTQDLTALPTLLPSAPSDGTASPQPSSDPGVSDGADPPTSSPPPSPSAQTSSTPSIPPSLTSSAPSTLVPTSTSTSSLQSSTSLPPSTSPSTPMSLSPASTSSPQAALASTTSPFASSSAPTTSFTTIVTTLGDGSVFTTVAPLPTSLQPNPNPSNPPNRVGIIAGTTVAVVSAILLVLSLVFCYRKNKLKKLWNSLDLRKKRARERRGLLEDEDFEDDLAHGRPRSIMTASGQGPFMLGRASINMSVGSSAGHQVGNSPALSNASARYVGLAIPPTSIPDPARSYSPNRSSFPPTTIISTPSINSSLPAIQSLPPSQTENHMPNSDSTTNYVNYNSSVYSIPHSSPPVPSLFRPRASESGSIFREEGVWPPPNEKTNDFVDPFIGHVKKVSGEIGDELGKIVRDVMGPSALGDSGSGSISSPTQSHQHYLSPSPSTMTMLSPSPPQSSMMQRAPLLSAPITSMTVAALGSPSGAANVVTGLDDRTGSRQLRENLDDNPASAGKSTYRHNPITPSPSSSPEPTIYPLSAPPPATANTNSKETSMGLSPHGSKDFRPRHRSSSSSSLSLPPGAAPSLIPGQSPVVRKSKSTILTSSMSRTLSPTTSMSPTTPGKSPTSAGTANTANTLNTLSSLNAPTMRSEESSVLYRYKDGGMPKVEEDFGSGDGSGSGCDAVSNSTRRMSSDGFEFLRGEKVDREVVSHELGILKEEARVGAERSTSPVAKRSSTLMSITSVSPLFTAPTATSSSSSLALSPTSSPTMNYSQVKKPSPLKQQTLVD